MAHARVALAQCGRALVNATPVVVDVLEGFDALTSLKERWDQLFLGRPNEPSTSFEWTRAMTTHHVQQGDRCLLVQLRRGEALIGIVPLVLRQMKIMGQSFGLLTPLSEENNTHSDLLLACADNESVSAFVTALFRLGVEWDCFRLARLLEQNPLVPALRAALTEGGHRYLMREGLPAYVLDLPSSYDDYLAGRSAKFRNHLKRSVRKLNEAGEVNVYELDQADAFEQAYEGLLLVERASWKQSHGTSIARVEHQAGFYRDFGQAAFGNGHLHLQWLTLDARPIAYNLGYMTRAGYHYLKTSYAAAYRPLSPATCLRARLVESLIARGVARLDFPGEPYEWEAQWTDTIRWRLVCAIYSPTVRGRALAVLDRLRHWRQPARTVGHMDPRAV